MSSFFLCGDVGGTNSRLQLYELLTNGTTLQKAAQVFPSRNYSHLTVIVKEFLTAHHKTGGAPLAACMAVAGPVKNNCCHVTNLVRDERSFVFSCVCTCVYVYVYVGGCERVRVCAHVCMIDVYDCSC
jgi:hypothetical protein